MTKKKSQQRARNKRLQKKRQKRRTRTRVRPALVIEMGVGGRVYDVLLNEEEAQALTTFAESTLDYAGETMAGKPEFTSERGRRAFEALALKGLVEPDGDPEEGYWILTAGAAPALGQLGIERPETTPDTVSMETEPESEPDPQSFLPAQIGQL